MKKWINKQTLVCFLVGAILFSSISVFADTQTIQAYFNDIRIRVNGTFIETDVEPCIINGRTMVPARFVAESLGATVSFNETDNCVDVIGGNVISFSNGDKYTGEIKNGVPYGKGTIAYADGSFYVGDFVEGLRQGIGHYIDLDGDMYFGNWSLNREQGKGYLSLKDGSNYYVTMDEGTIKSALDVTNITPDVVVSPSASAPVATPTPTLDPAQYQVEYDALTTIYNENLSRLNAEWHYYVDDFQSWARTYGNGNSEVEKRRALMDANIPRINQAMSDLTAKYNSDVLALKAKYSK